MCGMSWDLRIMQINESFSLQFLFPKLHSLQNRFYFGKQFLLEDMRLPNHRYILQLNNKNLYQL